MALSRVRTVLAGAALLGIGIMGTVASFSDSATTEILVTSATFELEVNGSSTGTYNVSIDAENIAPGENRTGAITLVNNSSVPATVSLAPDTLDGFTYSVEDDTNTAFTSVLLPAGGSENLDLTIGLPASATTSPADETLTLTFNAVQ